MSDPAAQQPLAGLASTTNPPRGLSGPVVRVLPDVLGIDKEFDYLVPPGVEVQVGDVVRIKLGPRRVGGWITAVDASATPGVHLIPLAKVSGRGPSPDLVDLAGWAAWRWVGRRANFLRSASPPAVVRSLPVPGPATATAVTAGPAAGDLVATPAIDAMQGVLRLGPAADRYPLLLAAVRAPGPIGGGHALVLCPSVAEARTLGRRLRADGVRTAIVTETGAPGAGEWARARAGAVVVGARAAAWAPVTPLGRVVVLDEHDETYQEEASPTWNARDVAIERARRAGVPCLLISPTPSLEALGWGELFTPSRADERAAWPRVEVVDQRDLDPTLGPLFSPALVRLVRSPGRVLCVLNRTGRARLLACAACSTLARCDVCEAAVSQAEAPGDGDGYEGVEELVCGRCGTRRPVVCLVCGGGRFKNLRLGVSRAREELEALAGELVAEVTASTAPDDDRIREARILIGTEAVLHRAGRAGAVAFLDFDQQLLAQRYRTGEQAVALLARAARVVRGTAGEHGRILIQTRTPDHAAVLAAQRADPSRLSESEAAMRTALRLPPVTAMAVISGQAAPAFMAALGTPTGLTIEGPVDGAWRLRASDHEVLCDALAAVSRPPGRLRIEVDPLGI